MFGIERETMGLWPKDSEGKVDIPAHLLEFDPNMQYPLDNILYVLNIAVSIFIGSIIYGTVKNIKQGMSYPLNLKHR